MLRSLALLGALMCGLGLACAATPNVPAPAPVWEYPIHADGGLVYDPLSREAAATGQLDRYRSAPADRREITLGRFRLTCSVPRHVRAYDVVPIPYALTWSEGDEPFPVAVEATAFEDAARRKGRDLFDLALPGRLSLKVDFLGSVTANLRPGGRHPMKPDLSDTPATYPAFDRKPFVRSGAIEAGDRVWLKFRYTNTGDTILDAEGMGGWLIAPWLDRKDAAGNWALLGQPYNLYLRDLTYIYPGESREVWLNFATNVPGETPQNFGLVPGEYRVRFRTLFRYYRDFNNWLNMWEGRDMVSWEMPFRVSPTAEQVDPAPCTMTLDDGVQPDKITRWIHTFEEFMTAFDCHQKQPVGAREVKGTLYLQVAPWTKHVIVKLISTGPVAIATTEVSVSVDASSLAIRPNPRCPTTVVRNGHREPAILSQIMADMRTNIQLGPFPEQHIATRLREMIDCGINLAATTNMPWIFDAPKGAYMYSMEDETSNENGDALKYALDLARRNGLQITGMGTYPINRMAFGEIYDWMTGTKHTYDRASVVEMSYADPMLPEVTTALWTYLLRRWGDLYYQSEDGAVPFDAEDTRGWMRQDVNIRYPIGELGKKAFRQWLRDRYATIEAVNAAWGTSYASLDAIDPEANQVLNQFGHIWEYTNPANPFHDWSPAIADFDRFRTELRVRNYRETLERMRKVVAEATVMIRTEGANALVSGLDPSTPNPHLRHVYYSQRRCGLIAEIVQASGAVRYHSDYTTIPYTPTEVRDLTRRCVQQGVIPAWMPQFDNMRDIAINAKYGTDYQVHYNLPEPRLGVMMHVLTAAYPWLRATYEEGGVPGMLWEDYQCDGFATETQKRELRLFSSHLPSTPSPVHVPSQAWRKGTLAKRSYVLSNP